MDEDTLQVLSEAERRRLPSPRAVPWLVIPHGKNGKDQSFYDLCDPNKTYLTSIPEMSCKWLYQSPSHQGWMIMICENKGNDKYSDPKWGDCFLWNPVSLETIRLPRLDIIDRNQYIFQDCVLSSPPSNKDSMVFILDNEDDYCTTPDLLLYCHPGDKDWRTMEVSMEKTLPGDLFCYKGRVYYQYLNPDFRNVIKELVPHHQSLCVNILHVKLNQSQAPLPPPLTIGHSCSIRKYYVESIDELFMVDIYYNDKRLATLQVMKMDLSSMSWQKVTSLEDHALFLGISTTASCSAVDLGYPSGCVYFVKPDDISLYTFDLEDESISVILPCPNLPSPWLTPDWVIMPATVRVADGRKAEHLQKRRKTEVIIIDEEENIVVKAENEEGQTNTEVELKQAGPWLNLDDSIKKCTSAIPVAKCRTSSTKVMQTTSLSPWLVFLKQDNGIYNFVDPMQNEKYTVDLSELLLDRKIQLSKGGWLLMSEGDGTFIFFNPLTRATIKLPYLQDQEEFYISGISFSSLPTSSDCVVFVIAHSSIFFITRGQSSWKQYDKNMEFKVCLSNPIFYAEAFYCLDRNGTLGVFDLLDDCSSWNVLPMPQSPCKAFDQTFLVECDGQLLALFLGHLGKWVQIYRLDFTRMIWLEVESLEKHMLFVSRSSCFSAVAPPNSRMENKIYFPRFFGEGIVFYSLDTGRYHARGSRHCAPDFHNTKEQIHSSWILPNWSQPTEQELNWLHI